MVVGVLILLQSRQAFGQVIFGDPTSTIGGPNRFSFSVGGGGVINQKFKFDAAPLTYVTPTQTFVFEGQKASIKFKGEHVFLTGAYRLGAAGEIFLTVGQTRIEDEDELFEGEFGMFLGGGIRISPPQPGPFKAGLVLQGFSGKTKEENYDVFLEGSQDNVTVGGVDNVSSFGTGEDEIEYTGLSAMIGVSAQYFASVRPYAGLVFTFIKGNEKGSVSGNGDTSHCATSGPNPCTFNSESFTASWDIDFESETTIGGIIGLQLNPEGPFTITLEGHLGTQDAYFVSAGMQF
jgi:hypothetical protein